MLLFREGRAETSELMVDGKFQNDLISVKFGGDSNLCSFSNQNFKGNEDDDEESENEEELPEESRV